MKIIVTHYSPDVDAVTSVWLLKRFLEGWNEAEVKFVAAGTTLEGGVVDSDSDIWHVDTGMGLLDHHQTDEDTCASKRVMEYITKKIRNQKSEIRNPFPDEALERMVDVVNDIDHFRESSYPNATNDIYDFGMVGIMDGWKLLYGDDHLKMIQLGMLVLDGIYRKFQDKIWAEKEISEKGIPFKTKWGKGIAVETVNDEIVRLAQKMGYVVAARKDPKKGYVRIKALPDSKADLTTCLNKLKNLDKNATWFLHASRKMVLNGSIKNPLTVPTNLTLREIVNVLRKK
jgi:hypothetical protein